MADKLRVAWYNGLSIDKIHFEQQERYLQRNIDAKTIAIQSNCYGIIDLKISNELLSQGKIALEYISGIAKDGSIFNAPSQDLLPEPLEINYKGLQNSIITIKIPLGVTNIIDIALQNSVADSKYIALRSVVASRIYDDVNGLNDTDSQSATFTQEKVNVTVASLRLKLGILGSATPDELEIPIAKIKSIDSNKKLELEEHFIPTCMNIKSISAIKAFLEEMLYSIKRHREILGDIFKGIDQTKNTLDFSTYLSLNLLKKWDLIFAALLQKDKIHPEALYDKLIEFQGELGAFGVDSSLEFIPYNHDELSDTFFPLINSIKMLFSKITSPKYSMARVINNGNGFYDLLFDNAGILEEAELFLAVNANANYEYILKNFKTQSKIHAQSKIKDIVATQLKGLNIIQIPNIPSSIPYLNGYVYYKIDKRDELFRYFKGESVISIYLTNNIKDPDIKMWAVFNG